MKRIAINGCGRIAKNFLRSIMLDPVGARKLNIVTINIGTGCLAETGLLIKYDTIMGPFPGTVEQHENTLIIDGYEIELIQELDPLQINWKKRDIDWVVDCTGKFTQREAAEKHLKAGAKAVLISAPAKNEDVAIIPGVNDHMFDPDRDKIVSLGSCTSNAFFPTLKVLHEECGLEYGSMITTHAYTNSQVLLDVDICDPRRSRAAALNIIPTSTGAAKMVGKILPALEGKIEAAALRVPVGNVSLLELTFTSSKKLTPQLINDAFVNAAATNLRGIIDIIMEPLVSIDFAGTDYSITIDGLLTQVNGPLARVSGWYDNEWAYSVRMKDFLLSFGE